MRHILTLALLVGASHAQQQIQALRVLGPVRDAGTYHVATGTWSHHGATANIGPDVVYNASISSGYFGTGWEGNVGIDEGRLPSPPVGPVDGYFIDGFEWSYCSLADTLDWSWQLLPSYVPCDLYGADAANCQEQQPGWLISGLPTAGACWTVTIDLSGGFEACIYGDGGLCAPGYQGAGLGLDHFGIAHLWSTGNGGTTGPLLEGHNPTWGPPGEGTCYNTALTCTSGATALGAQDLFAIDQGAIAPGCYFFGGYVSSNGCNGPHQVPGAQFSMRLFADCSLTCDYTECLGTVYCDVPTNEGDISLDTCLLDGGPGNTLTIDNSTSGLFGYFLISANQGSVTDPPGASGDLCVGPSGIGRYNSDLEVVVGGSFSTDIYNSISGGGSGGIPTLGGTLAAGDTWNFQAWIRVAGSSTFSSAMKITFY